MQTLSRSPFATLLVAAIASTALFGCQPLEEDPNILYSEEHKDPIKQLEVNAVPQGTMPYRHLFYVPVYSNIYVDEEHTKVMLSATLSIRNTSLDNNLYITKIDYYNTRGDFVRPYLTKSIELPPMGTLNYIVEKLDDTGGDGANFVVAIESKVGTVKPLLEAVMLGTFSNKGFAFKSEAVVIEDSDMQGFFDAPSG